MSGNRTLAGFAALAVGMLLVSACTASQISATTGPGSSTASTDVSSSTDPTSTTGGLVVTMDEALGGTQAVQDFTIYLGIWVQTGGGVGSLYQRIVDHAARLAGETSELQGGFSITPTDALEAEVVDADGELVPSLRVDFGLMDAVDEVMAGLLVTALAPIEDPDRPGVAEALTPDDSVDGRMIVEIVTADYAAARTHAGPGDATVLNLGFLQGVSVDDEIGASYLFGQTLPGDPAVEAGMSPHELFTYRWNRGLVRVLADGSGRLSSGLAAARGTGLGAIAEAPSPVPALVPIAVPARMANAALAQGEGGDGSADDAEAAAPDPALVKLVKELVLARVVGETIASTEDDFWEEARNQLDGGDRDFLYVNRRSENGLTRIIDVSNRQIVYVTGETAREMWTRLEPGECPGRRLACMLDRGEILGIGDPDRLLREYALDRALRRCAAVAAELNRRNGAASSPSQAAVIERDPREGSSVSTSGGAEADIPSDEGDDGDDGPDRPPPVDCPPPPNDTPPPPASGLAWGDVHISTIDGRYYANQAAGEFLLFDNGVAEIQMRTEPWGTSSDVSVVTAFAARIDDHEISMHADDTTWIDGRIAHIDRGETIDVGEGELLWWDQGWVVLWPDGTVFKAQITAASQLGQVTPSNRKAIGLLGDFDGDPNNDFFTRDGEILPTSIQDDFKDFYRTYVASWRISDEESAFHYETGETTATFTDESFPARPAPKDDLPVDARIRAEEVCGRVGVEREEIYAACVLDVAVTGEPWFAYQSVLAQQAIPAPSSGDRDPSDPSPGGVNALVFGDTSVLFGPEPPVIDPSGPAPRWTCEVDDGVYTVISSFAESPTVNWQLDLQYISPDNARNFEEAFRLIVRRNGIDYAWVQTIAEQFTDSVDSVSLDGDTLTATGELYVNDPPTPGLGPVNPLPAGADLTPFTLQATCG